jgi:hypothetical protein
LISIRISGGKAGWPPAAILLFQSGYAVLKEPLPPFADDLPRSVKPGGDLVVVEAIGSVKDDLGTDDVSIR